MKLYCPECETRYEGDEYQNCPADGARLFRLDSDDDKGDPLVGKIIDDRFRIEDLIGAGGMGAVYRAVQLSVNRDVALKVLRAELADEEVALERFYREAKVVSDLSHPNIVRLVDFGRDDQHSLLYLVMEMVKGMDLGDLLKRGRLTPNLALEIIYQTCGALTEPHARGIVHRDLKPENLIIVPISDGTFQVKVLDFGIARALEGGATQLTKTGMICGTPSYMSPEQAQNDDMDGRTDLYALGVILFEMLTGQPPFSGDTSLQVLLNHIRKPAPDLGQLIPSELVAGPICELVGDLLAKHPEHRPRSARAVRDRVDAIRRQLQLEPVRLKADATGEEAFDGWIHRPLGFVDADGNFSVDSEEELPATHTTGEAAGVEIRQSHTEMEESGADASGSSAERERVDAPSGGTDIRAPVASTQGQDSGAGMTAEVDAAASEELTVASGDYDTMSHQEPVDVAKQGSKRLLFIVGGLGLIGALCIATAVVAFIFIDGDDVEPDDEDPVAVAQEPDSEEEEGDDGDPAPQAEADDDDAQESDERDDEEEPTEGPEEVAEEPQVADEETHDEEAHDEEEPSDEVEVTMEVEATDSVAPADEEEQLPQDEEEEQHLAPPAVPEPEPQPPEEPDEEEEAAAEEPDSDDSPAADEEPQEESDEAQEEESDDVRDRLRRLRSD